MAREPHAWFRKQTGWWMTTINRKKINLVKGANKEEEAKRKLRELLYLRDKNPAPESGELTVAAVIDLYMTHARAKLSSSTYEVCSVYWQLFAEEHGFRTVNDRECLPFHLTSWLDKHPEWVSDWTKHHAVSTVQAPFNWAARQRLITANPFRGVTHGAGAPRRPMTDQEFEKLLQLAMASTRATLAKERLREILTFLRITGARPGEAYKLEWSHIDLEKAVIVLTEHKTSRTQRQPRPRVIPLTQEVVELLKVIRLRQEPGERVFRSVRGKPWKRHNLTARIKRLRRLAGIPEDAKLYGLRHAFGTRAIVNGVDIKTLAQLMGHTTVQMTEHYLNHLGDHTGHLAAAMSRVSPPTTPVAAKPPEGDQSPGSGKTQPPSAPSA